MIACDTSNGEQTHGPDISNLPLLDGGRRRLPDGAIVEADGAPVTGDDDDAVGGDSASTTCTGGGTAAVVAGSAGALTAAIRTSGGAWKATTIAGGTANSKPALVALGGGFIGAAQGADGALESIAFDGAAWKLAKIGVAGVKGPPTLAVLGTKAHVVYSAGPADNHDYKHGVYDGTAWDAALEDVGTGGTEHSFGTISAGLAPFAAGLVFAENGSDQGLYARPYDTTWKLPIAINGAGTIGAALPVTPVALAVTGKYDVVIIYGYKSSGHALAYATHTAGAADWGNADTQFVVGGSPATGALTAEKFDAVAVNGTTIYLAFKDDGGHGMYAVGTMGDTPPITWTAPAPISGSPLTVDSTPAVAKGDCGNDAIFTYASGGVVSTTSLKGTTFSAPAAVAGVNGAYVAIATK